MKKYNASKLGATIKRHRTKLGLTRDQLSKKARVNYNTIIKLESGANKNPTVKTLIGLATVFDSTLDDMMS